MKKFIILLVLLINGFCGAQHEMMLMASQEQYSNETSTSVSPKIEQWTYAEDTDCAFDIAKPTGVEAGDLLMVFYQFDYGNPVGNIGFLNTIDGFELQGSLQSNGQDVSQAIYARIADGTESANLSLDSDLTGFATESQAWYLRISGVNETKPFSEPVFDFGSTGLQSIVRNTDDIQIGVYAHDGADGFPHSVSTGWTIIDEDDITSGSSAGGISGLFATLDTPTINDLNDVFSVSPNVGDGAITGVISIIGKDNDAREYENLVINPYFDNANNLSLQDAEWSIGGGLASFTGNSTSRLSSDLWGGELPLGTYTLTFDILNAVSNPVIEISLFNDDSSKYFETGYITYNGNGTYSLNVVPTGSRSTYIQFAGSFSGDGFDLDNIIFEEFNSGLILNGTYDNTNDLTVPATWTVSGGTATYNGSSEDHFIHELSEDIVSGDEIEIKLDVSGSSGSSRFRVQYGFGGGETIVPLAIRGDGAYTFTHTLTTTEGNPQQINIRGSNNGGGGAFTIDNFSLKKIN